MIDNFQTISFSNTDHSWYTPAYYCDLVREVVGEIELDPASSEEANQYVGAKIYFTKEQDGLQQSWAASTVFLNAPGKIRGGGGGQAQWQAKLIEEYKKNKFEQAIMLVYKVATETKWFQELLKNYPICFVNHRIKFIPPVGKYAVENSQPLHGNAFVYFGKDAAKFKTVFSKIGTVIDGRN